MSELHTAADMGVPSKLMMASPTMAGTGLDFRVPKWNPSRTANSTAVKKQRPLYRIYYRL
jgi:hypothetical protein